jgi:Cytotoxic
MIFENQSVVKRAVSDSRQPLPAGTGTGRIVRPFPPGDTLPGYPTAVKTHGKTPRMGGGRRSRWKMPDGTILERDYLHNTVEVYDPSGRRHLGDFDPWDSRQVGAPDPTRHVEP